MALIRLVDVENFKKIVAVRLDLENRRVVQLTGKNAAGKSSVLDAIEAVLGGKKAEPLDPVRHGETTARAAVVIDDRYLVEKVWSEDGRSRLRVTSPDGRQRFSSPQTLLDEIRGDRSFDPVEFVRLAPPKQAAILRELAGIDLEELDRERDAVYEQRTTVNRAVDAAKAKLGAIDSEGPIPHGTPDQKPSLSELADEYSHVQGIHRKVDELSRRRTEHLERIEQLKQQLQAATEAVAACDLELEQIGEPPALDELERRMSAVEAVHRDVDRKLRRAQATTELREFEGRSKEFTAEIQSIDRKKQQQIAEAKYPVPGLSVQGDRVLFNDIVLSQASESERLRVSAAIGMALNPNLRTMWVREGGVLDTDSFAELASIAEEHDYQLIIETPTDGQPVGIVIEEGQVVGDYPTALERREKAPAGGEQQEPEGR